MKFGLVVLIISAAIYESATGKKSSKKDSNPDGPRRMHGHRNITDDVKYFHKKMNASKARRGKLEEKTLGVEQKELIDHFGKRNRTHLRSTGDNLAEVNRRQNLTDRYFEGDVVLTNEQTDAILMEDTLTSLSESQMDYWYNALLFCASIPYVVIVLLTLFANAAAHSKTIVRLAMELWSNNTCIDFHENRTAPNRVNFFVGAGCYSYLGAVGGVQQLSIGTGCEAVGIAVHEIAHALAFFHEQSRYDRDDSITVVRANIVSGWESQVSKQTRATNDNLGLPISSNGKPSMLAKITQYQDTMGSEILSFRDAKEMNLYYGCTSNCASHTNFCQNGGILRPRNCSTCICPSGYGGTTCNTRPPGCGSTVVATAELKSLILEVGSNFGMQDMYTFCNWRIEAPIGKKIVASITAYAKNVCYEGCPYGGIEMKWRNDMTLTGSRYCCPDDVGQNVTTSTNVLPIIGFSRYGRESATISYKYV